jgi:hypothetical protein
VNKFNICDFNTLKEKINSICDRLETPTSDENIGNYSNIFTFYTLEISPSFEVGSENVVPDEANEGVRPNRT